MAEIVVNPAGAFRPSAGEALDATLKLISLNPDHKSLLSGEDRSVLLIEVGEQSTRYRILRAEWVESGNEAVKNLLSRILNGYTTGRTIPVILNAPDLNRVLVIPLPWAVPEVKKVCPTCGAADDHRC